MFIFSTPEDSEKEFDKLIEIQKELYNLLEIPFK
jgi:seryl-tRNA synthetase